MVVLFIYFQVCKFLLSLQKISGESFNYNAPDELFGETGLYSI